MRKILASAALSLLLSMSSAPASTVNLASPTGTVFMINDAGSNLLNLGAICGAASPTLETNCAFQWEINSSGQGLVLAAESGTWTVTGAGGTFPVTGTFWQATQPVSIAIAPALVASSAIIGKVDIDQTTPGTTNGVSEVAATTGGATPVQKATLTTAIVVKASAGQVYKIQCDNLAGTLSAWVQILNTASSPALGTNILDTVPVAAGGTGGFSLPVGEVFGTGISIGAATTPTGSTAVSTAVNCAVAYK